MLARRLFICTALDTRRASKVFLISSSVGAEPPPMRGGAPAPAPAPVGVLEEKEKEEDAEEESA